MFQSRKKTRNMVDYTTLYTVEPTGSALKKGLALKPISLIFHVFIIDVGYTGRGTIAAT